MARKSRSRVGLASMTGAGSRRCVRPRSLRGRGPLLMMHEWGNRPSVATIAKVPVIVALYEGVKRWQENHVKVRAPGIWTAGD